MRVLVIGRTEILYNTILELQKEHEIAAIITAKASAESLKTENDFEELARKLNAPFRVANRISDDVNNLIKTVKPDIGVSMNWVSVITEKTIDLIPKGILNAHFADLPRFRGNAVANWAILLNEKKIPFTIHYMTPGVLDSGDILLQQHINIGRDTNIKDIYDAALRKIPEMYKTVLEKIGTGRIKPLKQNKTGKKGFRCYPRLPTDSRIDWKLPATRINALIRASTKPFSGAYTYLKDKNQNIKKVYIWKSRVVLEKTKDIGTPGQIIKNDVSSGESWIYTGQGIIGISSVSYEGENLFEPGKVWKSIRMRFGFDAEEEFIAVKKELEKIKRAMGLDG